MEIKALKGDYGWEARNLIPAPELGAGKYIMFLTMKRYSGAFASTAQVVSLENGCPTFSMFGDYRKGVIVKMNARATQKAVNEQQAAAVAMLPQVLEDAKAFYAKQAAEGPFSVIAGA